MKQFTESCLDHSRVVNIYRLGNSHLRNELSLKNVKFDYHLDFFPGYSILDSFISIKNKALLHRDHNHTHLAIDFGGNEIHGFMEDFILPSGNNNIQKIINGLQGESVYNSPDDPFGILPLYPECITNQINPLIQGFVKNILSLGRCMNISDFILRLPGPRLLRNEKEGGIYNIICYFFSYTIKRNLDILFQNKNVDILDPFLNVWTLPLASSHTLQLLFQESEVIPILKGHWSRYGATHYKPDTYHRIHIQYNQLLSTLSSSTVSLPPQNLSKLTSPSPKCPIPGDSSQPSYASVAKNHCEKIKLIEILKIDPNLQNQLEEMRKIPTSRSQRQDVIISSCFITQEELSTLRPKQMIDSAILQNYFKLLESSNSNIYIAPFRLAQIILGSENSVISPQDIFNEIKIEDFTKDIMFFPIFTLSHFCLVVYDPSKLTVEYYDSIKFNTDTIKSSIFQKIPTKFCNFISSFLSSYQVEVTLNIKINHQHPYQENGYDCGLYVMHYISQLSKGRLMNSEPLNSDIERLKITYEVTHKTLVNKVTLNKPVIPVTPPSRSPPRVKEDQVTPIKSSKFIFPKKSLPIREKEPTNIKLTNRFDPLKSQCSNSRTTDVKRFNSSQPSIVNLVKPSTAKSSQILEQRQVESNSPGTGKKPESHKVGHRHCDRPNTVGNKPKSNKTKQTDCDKLNIDCDISRDGHTLESNEPYTCNNEVPSSNIDTSSHSFSCSIENCLKTYCLDTSSSNKLNDSHNSPIVNRYNKSEVSLNSPGPPKLSPKKKLRNNQKTFPTDILFLEPTLTPQIKRTSQNFSRNFTKYEINRNPLCSPDQWPILKPIFNVIKDTTQKIIKQQFHLAFLEHCIVHNITPLGLNLSPNCLNFVKNSKYKNNWDITLTRLGRDLLRITIKALRESIRDSYSSIISLLSNLKELASELNYQALYSSISRRSKMTAKYQYNYKVKKSLKLFDCQNFEVEHFHSNIFKVNIKIKCKSQKTRRKPRRIKKLVEPSPNTVVNLSSYQLSEPESKLLGLEEILNSAPLPKE